MFPLDIDGVNKEYADKEALYIEKGYSSSHFSLIFYNIYTKAYCPDDIKDVSKQIDYLIADCDFFKNRNKKKLDDFSTMLKHLNRIAMESKLQISVDVNLLGDNVHINIFSTNSHIGKELLPLLAYALTKSDGIYYSSFGIDFFFSFE